MLLFHRLKVSESRCVASSSFLSRERECNEHAGENFTIVKSYGVRRKGCKLVLSFEYLDWKGREGTSGSE